MVNMMPQCRVIIVIKGQVYIINDHMTSIYTAQLHKTATLWSLSYHRFLRLKSMAHNDINRVAEGRGLDKVTIH